MPWNEFSLNLELVHRNYWSTKAFKELGSDHIYNNFLDCFSGFWHELCNSHISKCYLNVREFQGRMIFLIHHEIVHDKWFLLINFYRTFLQRKNGHTEDTFQIVLDFYHFSSFGVFITMYLTISPTLTSHIKKDTHKNLILSFMTFSKNLKIR